jgi:hypothetical protein
MMHDIEKLLARLEHVKQTSPNSWLASCPAHDDKHPSLSIRETSEGFILIHCFAGCAVHEVIAAAGISMDQLFPTRPDHHRKPERRPFPATDVLRAIAFESLVVAVAGVSMLAGESFTEIDRERLILAVSRIQSAMTAAGVTDD